MSRPYHRAWGSARCRLIERPIGTTGLVGGKIDQTWQKREREQREASGSCLPAPPDVINT